MKPGLGSYDAEPLPAAHSSRERFPTPEIRSSKAKGSHDVGETMGKNHRKTIRKNGGLPSGYVK